MENQPKISVIITTYNNDQYIRDCVKSVQQQTYQNLEILIMIDGSTDQTLAICEKLRQQDSRIRICVKHHVGISALRNAALQLITGDFLTFVDGDDTIGKTMINDLFQQMRQDQSDMVCGNAYRIDNDGTYYFFVDSHSPKQQKLTGAYLPEKWVLMENNIFTFPMPWAKIYKKELFQQIEYPVNQLAEDNLTTWKLALTAKTVSYVNIQEYCWRLRKDSITEHHKNDFKVLKNNLRAIQERIQLYPLLNIDSKFLYDKYLGYLKIAKEKGAQASKTNLLKNASYKLQLLKKYR